MEFTVNLTTQQIIEFILQIPPEEENRSTHQAR